MMKYNILIHAINGIGIGHINRLLVLAKEIRKDGEIGDIIFVTNSLQKDFIKKDDFKVEHLDIGIEDTIKGVDFKDYEDHGFKKIKELVQKYHIHIIIHDTFFITSVVKNIREVSHFLVLRDIEIEHLRTVASYFSYFRSIYIPHIKEELSIEKQEIYKKYNNIFYIGYVFEKQKDIVLKDKNIIISPGYGGDYENVKYFFDHIFYILSCFNLNEYKIYVFLGKYFKQLSSELSIPKNIICKEFDNNYKLLLQKSEIFIGRGGYNSVLEAIAYKCKTLFFEVDRFAESQSSRIDFFQSFLHCNYIHKGEYKSSDKNIFYDLLIRTGLERRDLDFDGAENFGKYFLSEIKKPNILVFKNIFLPKSENFIYEELTSLKNFYPIIFSLKNENNEIFQIKFLHFYIRDLQGILNNNYPLGVNLLLLRKLFVVFGYIIKKYNISVIYTEFLFDFYLLQKIKKFFSNIKIVSAGRGYDIYSFLPSLQDKSFLNSLDCLFVRDVYMKKFAIKEGFSEEKIEVIKSVINLEKYQFVKKDFSKLNILIGGRFVEKKGILELLDLIFIISKSNYINKISLVGDGELKEKVLNKIKELNLQEKIRYVGFLSHEEFLKELNNHNCFINYSKIAKNGDSEGVNNMIVENMLSGNLVFSTLVGGIGEALINQKTGILLNGSIKDDAEVILRLVEQQSLILEITQNANAYIRANFSQKFSTEILEENFKKLLF